MAKQSKHKITGCANPNYKIDLNHIHFDAFTDLVRLDDSYIGTKKYMGLAYFWSGEYKQILRSVTIKSRIKIHNELLDAGLELHGESREHLEIICKYAYIDGGLYGDPGMTRITPFQWEGKS